MSQSSRRSRRGCKGLLHRFFAVVGSLAVILVTMVSLPWTAPSADDVVYGSNRDYTADVGAAERWPERSLQDIVGAAGADAQFTDETSELEVLSPSAAAGQAAGNEVSQARASAPAERPGPGIAAPYGPITEAAGDQGEDPFSGLEARES